MKTTTEAFLSLFLLLCCSCAVVVAATYDCDEGCSTDPDIMGSSVCGADDGILYLNECIAFCQGVAISATEQLGCTFGGGPSGNREDPPASQTNIDTRAVINLEEMNRFSDDGYKFVARRDPDKFSREKPDAKKIYSQRPLDDEIKKTPPAGPAQEDKEDEESTLRFVQMTMEGSEYVKQIKKSELREQSARYEKGDSTTKASPPVATLPDGTNNRKTRGLGQKNDRRQLNTIGTDDRSYVTDTTVFPYSAVAQVDFDIFFGAGGCTATMISRNVALTAGHCVFVEGNWKYVPWIAPGRNLATSGFVVEPYGLWAADTLITLTEWTTQETIEHDMAVITLVPIQADPGNECADLYPGDVTGYIGFDRAERGDQRLPTATITGYPGDKPYGSMWDTGICQAPPGEPSNWVPFPDKTHFSLHFCDTAGGMSGSAVLANENIALGDHAYGFSDQNNVPIANGATMMETDYFDAILDWSGRLKDLPSCSQCRSSSSGLFFGRCK